MNEEEIKIEGTADINQALKEFETKSSAEEAQKIPETSETPDVPKMVGLAMKWFKIKEQKTAEYILLGLVVLMLAVSFYLFLRGTEKKVPTPTFINQSEFAQ